MTTTARATLLAELLNGEDPASPEYRDACARLIRLIDNHHAEVLTEAADHFDHLADKVEARVADHYGPASGIGPGSAAMVREVAKDLRTLAGGAR